VLLWLVWVGEFVGRQSVLYPDGSVGDGLRLGDVRAVSRADLYGLAVQPLAGCLVQPVRPQGSVGSGDDDAGGDGLRAWAAGTRSVIARFQGRYP